VLNLLIHIKIRLYISTAIGYAITAYYLNSRWTYERLRRKLGFIGLAKYLSVCMISLVAAEIIMVRLVGNKGFNLNLAKMIAIIIVFSGIFVNRYWTFRL